MAYPARLLGEGEHIGFETRPHWRVLFVPLVGFLVTIAVAGYLEGKLGGTSTWRTWGRWIVFLLAASAISYWVIRPVIFWATTLYVFTNRRIITRTGLVARRGRDMPLSRVNDVSFNHTVLERIFNCGTLMVESAGERGQLQIDNVPNVESLQAMIYRLHEEDDVRRRRAVEQGEPAGSTELPDDGT